VSQLALELAAKGCERRVVKLKRLEDDRRAALELGGDSLDPSRPGEGLRRPRDVLRIVAEHELLALLDDPERRISEASSGDAAFDLGDREQVVEAPLLVAWDEEGPPLPVLVEEPIGLDRLDAAR